MSTLSSRERATAELYAHLHAHASPTFAEDYLLPGFRRHLADLGLDADTALRGASFLDAGCGGFAGGAAMALELGAADVVGVDLSDENVRAARARFARAPAARFARHNLRTLAFGADRFDFVYCNGVLHHTEDPEAAFRELVRVLKPGGRIYIGVYGRGGLYNELFVPLSRAAGRLVPRRLTASLLRLAPRLLRPSSSLMDLMYVPLQTHYRRSEVAAWFERAGIAPTGLRHYYQPDSFWMRLLVGDGTMIFFSGVKPADACSSANASRS